MRLVWRRVAIVCCCCGSLLLLLLLLLLLAGGLLIAGAELLHDGLQLLDDVRVRLLGLRHRLPNDTSPAASRIVNKKPRL